MKIQTPNVIIIYADDLGYGDLSCYGAADINTPNVDALAAQGLRFTQGYSTSPVCTPARYSLITGRYPSRREGVHILPGDAPDVGKTSACHRQRICFIRPDILSAETNNCIKDECSSQKDQIGLFE